MSDVFRLGDRVVMVTGAVGNLGQVLANTLRNCGARLALLDRAADRLATTFPELRDDPAHLLLTGVDVGSESSVADAVERTWQRFGRVDGLVNTVGGFRGGKPVHESDPADWDAMWEMNVKTTLNACRAAIPAMLRRKRGTIVNVSSLAALRGEATLAAYSTAKAAVVRLTESLSAELRPSGINVNCVLPGTLDTPQNRKAIPSADTSDWVRLEDVARVIAFFCGDGVRAIHGAAIPVFGSRA